MKPRAIHPPATIGILGSGQLGRMLALAARQMGYGVGVFSPDRDTPAGAVADFEVVAAYDDLDAVREFARRVAVVTFEFENVPSATAEAAAEVTLVRPEGSVLHIAQNRLREKRWLESNGFPVAPYRHVTDADALRDAYAGLGEGIAKTAGFGYDGKGQSRIRGAGEIDAAWSALRTGSAVYEQLVRFECEVSVVVARAADGLTVPFPVTRNDHQNHILDISSTPAQLAPSIEARALELATAIAERIELVGVMGVEMFVARGQITVNELAPRTHNSGHWTLGGALTSQFEQQIRAICGLPLGATDAVGSVAMANLLGDLWRTGEPDWSRALADRHVQLHLYGKRQPRPGRKMGHLLAFGTSAAEAIECVRSARNRLTAR